MNWQVWVGIAAIVFLIVFQNQIRDGAEALWKKVRRKGEGLRANDPFPAMKNPLEFLEQRLTEAVKEIKEHVDRSNRQQAVAIVKATNIPVLTDVVRADDYVPNPMSNTPDWRKWTDTSPEGYPIKYEVVDGQVDLGKGYQVNYLGVWVDPDGVSKLRKEFLQKETALDKN